jgi:hypothetical protein
MPTWKICVVLFEGMAILVYGVSMVKKKTTMYLEADVLRGVRVMAVRTGKQDHEVVEDALRAYLGMEVLGRAWAFADMDEGEALQLAVDEAHRFRTGVA